MNLRQIGYLMLGFIIVIGCFLIFINYQAGNTTQSALNGPSDLDWSEQKLKVSVSSALAASPNVSALNVDVKVSGSKVTLVGSVQSEQEKFYATDVVSKLDDVNNVENNLTIKQVGVDDAYKTLPMTPSPG